MSGPLNVALIDQPTGGRDDRVSRQIAERGHTLIWVRPAGGDALPRIDEIDACVVYGGSGSANDDTAHMRETVGWTARYVARGKPFFGICLGAQILAKALGAEVYPCERENGFTPIRPSGHPLLPEATSFYQWHGQTFDIPASARVIGTGARVPNQAFALSDSQIGVQFHPDVWRGTCERWLGPQRALWTDEYVALMEAHLPLFDRYDGQVDAWVSRVLDAWER